MTTDELALRYEALAGDLAARVCHRVPGCSADFHDLKQEAWVAVLLAARSFDPTRGIPFKRYAELLVRRRLNRTIRVCRRRGFRCVGEWKGHEYVRDFRSPVVAGLGERDVRVEDRRRPPAGFAEALGWLASQGWAEPEVCLFADMIMRLGLNTAEVGRHLGCSRQNVQQKLQPIRKFLREVL